MKCAGSDALPHTIGTVGTLAVLKNGVGRSAYIGAKGTKRKLRTHFVGPSSDTGQSKLNAKHKQMLATEDLNFWHNPKGPNKLEKQYSALK